MASIIGGIVTGVLGLANKYIADPAERDKFALEMATLQQQSEQVQAQADAQVAVAQNQVNQVQAGSSDKFTSRARPWIMYICGAGFGYQYILQPFIVLLLRANHIDIVVPNLDMSAITTLLMTLCGARTYEKIKGVA